MNSIDDTTVVTSTDTWNLSSSESISSDFSQPTVKLRVNEEPKNRKIEQDFERIFNANDNDPFIETLGKDGCYLVEKTGRTAQRTRASIKNSYRYNEKIDPMCQSQRSMINENPWLNYSNQRKKCYERNANRKLNKRHSCNVESSRKSWDKLEFKETPKRYSAGDYLRQQILEDLNSNEIIGKTDQQIAEDRCKRIKAYLRRRNDDSQYVSPETRLKELRDWSKFDEHEKDSSVKANRRKDLDRIRSFLQEKIRMRMNEEKRQISEIEKSSADYENELSIRDIRTRYLDYGRVNESGNYPTRRVRSDVNIRLKPSSSDSEKDYDIVLFGNRKGSRKKGNVCRRTRSDIVPEMVIDLEDNEVKKRFHSYSGWKTKNGLIVEKTLGLPNKMAMNLDHESDNRSIDCKQNDDELSIRDIRTRYLDYCRVNESGNYPTRRVRSDVNIRLKPSSSDSEKDYDIVPFGNRKGSRKKGNVCRRTRSDIVPEMVIDLEDNEVKKRFHSYSGWKTKNGLIVEKTLELPNKMAMNLDRENDNQSIDYKQNDWQYRNFVDERNNDVRFDKKLKKYCRRTRSDMMTNKLIERTTFGRTAKQRSISCSDKRKLHWKTSDGSSDLMDSSGFDFEINSTNLRRIRNQQKSSLYSWREYKEKRRQDEMRKELADAEGHQNFTKLCSIPAAWKDFQKSFSSPNESQLLMNIENTKKLKDQKSSDRSDIYLFANDDKADDETNTNESSIKFSRCIGVDNANDTETETILQENYLLLEREVNERDENDRSPTISRLQVNEYRNEGDSVPHESKTSDIGYHSIIINRKSGERCNRIEFNTNSNVKKSDTFKIVDGSENTMVELCDKSKFSWPSNDSKCLSLGNEIIRSCKKTAETTVTSRHSKDDDSRIVTVAAATDDDDDDDTLALSNKDIATDYFRRVYELLKQRQEDARRETPEVLTPTRYDSDTSSTNFDEHEEEVRKRRRRRKKDKNYQGEDPVVVSPGMRTGDNGWKVQRLLVNNDPENIIFRRPQLQNVTGFKRPRHPAPPIPTNCKINAKDISKYFDYPNKENSPRNGVNENRQSDRNESIEKQRQRVDSNEKEMGSNLSRHNGKGLTGRRTQSSGNLCDPKGKLNHVGKILVPCSSTQRETYKICGSLPNHLDDKEILYNDDPRENNNVISDNIVGNFGGSLPHKKRSLGVHFSDTDPTDTLDLVKHRSQDSLEGDPWRYQEGVDLDLVRCKHGNLDVVRKNHSIDVMDDDSSGKTCGTIGRSSDGKCHHGADLDLVGTLPKIRAGETKGAGLSESLEARPNRSVDRTDGESLIKAMHKPDCELMKHHRFDRVVDLKLSRLASGEPQDQGYASERSPEEEHPPSLPGQAFPKVTPENTFRVTLQKSSRGLGLSVSGGATAGPVRVKRLFPQQPAALSKKLQSGDILLAANGVSLTGLTNYEALEVLRTTPSTVELVVCRVPGDTTVTSPGAPPPPPARRELSLRILNPLPPLQIEPCGEFDIEMTKVAGSLGFTLRKVDSSALGHYVRALVREPALSDGRIQPGDKIVSVDGAPLSPMSHEEAVALLRQCGPRVKLRLYRDMAQTPVSALSPTEPDHPLRPPRTSLRQEAVDMLCDLAVRKLSPGTSNGSNSRQTSAASCHSPRRLRKPLSRTPTAENDHENHLTFHLVHPPTTSQPDASDIDQCSINTHASNSQSETPSNDIIDPPPLYDVCDSSDSSKALSRPSFLDLSVQPEKPHFQFSLESESDNTGPIIVTESDSNLTGECDYDDDLGKKAPALSSDEHDNNLPLEPASMPPLLSASRTTSGAFSYKNPAYQSANPTCGGIDNSTKNKTAHSSDQDIPGKILGGEDPAGSKGLLKWKGVMFAPDDGIEETNGKVDTEEAGKESTTEFATLNAVSEDGNEVFTVELTRGWNSRLGFSLQPEGNSTVISVVHPDSVAAKDGRLKEGDVLIMVNDESVENMLTAEIIDLLRKIRGSIGITVMRKNKTKNAS